MFPFPWPFIVRPSDQTGGGGEGGGGGRGSLQGTLMVRRSIPISQSTPKTEVLVNRRLGGSELRPSHHLIGATHQTSELALDGPTSWFESRQVSLPLPAASSKARRKSSGVGVVAGIGEVIEEIPSDLLGLGRNLRSGSWLEVRSDIQLYPRAECL